MSASPSSGAWGTGSGTSGTVGVSLSLTAPFSRSALGVETSESDLAIDAEARSSEPGFSLSFSSSCCCASAPCLRGLDLGSRKHVFLASTQSRRIASATALTPATVPPAIAAALGPWPSEARFRGGVDAGAAATPSAARSTAAMSPPIVAWRVTLAGTEFGRSPCRRNASVSRA